MDLAKMFELKQKLDGETAKLWVEFVLRAMRETDPNRYVKRALKLALELPENEVVSAAEGPPKPGTGDRGRGR